MSDGIESPRIWRSSTGCLLAF